MSRPSTIRTHFARVALIAAVAPFGCADDAQTDDVADATGDTSSAPDVSAASDAGADATNDAGATDGYGTCGLAEHLGTFTIELQETYTSVQGQIRDGVSPSTVSVVELEAEGCALLRPPQLLCDPACSGGQTCGADGVCVDQPVTVDVGEVTVDGLEGAVSMTARAPVYYYSFNGDLPHPAFDSTTHATLTAAGATLSGFTMSAPGVEPLETSMTDVALHEGAGASLTWTPGTSTDGVRVVLELNIANHGGTPGRIACEVPDTGEFTIPAELVDALLAGESSGFPSLRMTRQGAAAARVAAGCIDLRLVSERVLDVVIDGLISCSLDEDCPDGQFCQPDLTCG